MTEMPGRRQLSETAGRKFVAAAGDGRTLQRLARGGAAFDGIIKFLAAGAAGARALAGGNWVGHRKKVFYGDSELA